MGFISHFTLASRNSFIAQVKQSPTRPSRVTRAHHSDRRVAGLLLQWIVRNTSQLEAPKQSLPQLVWSWGKTLGRCFALYFISDNCVSDAGFALTSETVTAPFSANTVVHATALRISALRPYDSHNTESKPLLLVQRALAESAVADETLETSRSLAALAEAAQRCRDALATLRTSLQPASPNQDILSNKHDTSPQQPQSTDSSEEQRQRIESFRLSLRKAPVSETRRRFYELARALDEVHIDASTPPSRGMAAYRKVARALDALDVCALQASRTQGLEQAEKLLALNHELYDRVLHEMDQMLQQARQSEPGISQSVQG